MTDSAHKGEAMEIETEKNKVEHITPNKDPSFFHLGERESLSGSKYLQRIKTQRIVDNKRLIIHKITLENFKSYAGVREIGPFHKVKFLIFPSNIFSRLLQLWDPTVQESQI